MRLSLRQYGPRRAPGVGEAASMSARWPWSRLASVATMLVGTLVLVGWALDVRLLKPQFGLGDDEGEYGGVLHLGWFVPLAGNG